MTEFLTQLGEFLIAPSTWSGSGSIPTRLAEHIWMSIVPTVVAGIAVLPPALWLAHRRRGAALAGALVNIGRAVPSFGILVIVMVLLIQLGVSVLSPVPAIVALVALAAPPMFTNAVAGVETVPGEVVESARGMGFTGRQVLGRVELPLGSPVIVEGVRIALVQVIATAPLAALIGGGGLGRFIVDGFAKQRGDGELFVGAVLVGLLAVTAQWGLGAVERRFTPPGVVRRDIGNDPARGSVGQATGPT
ncbi:MAG: ABC transporter permease subunit [Acidimicrobiia bacterium]|jgi:osmoprotectant transport system permease protein